MSLLGRGVVYGADALRILAVVCVIKAVPMVIGPALFLVRAQRYALAYMLMALSVKIAVIAGMALKFGYMGRCFREPLRRDVFPDSGDDVFRATVHRVHHEIPDHIAPDSHRGRHHPHHEEAFAPRKHPGCGGGGATLSVISGWSASGQSD